MRFSKNGGGWAPPDEVEKDSLSAFHPLPSLNTPTHRINTHKHRQGGVIPIVAKAVKRFLDRRSLQNKAFITPLSNTEELRLWRRVQELHGICHLAAIQLHCSLENQTSGLRAASHQARLHDGLDDGHPSRRDGYRL